MTILQLFQKLIAAGFLCCLIMSGLLIIWFVIEWYNDSKIFPDGVEVRDSFDCPTHDNSQKHKLPEGN